MYKERIVNGGYSPARTTPWDNDEDDFVLRNKKAPSPPPNTAHLYLFERQDVGIPYARRPYKTIQKVVDIRMNAEKPEECFVYFEALRWLPLRNGKQFTAPITEDIISEMGDRTSMEVSLNRGYFVIRVGTVQEDKISMTTWERSEKED